MVDVVIVGAGISGISAAVHLQRDCPDKTFVILEGRSAIGGTWDLFRYPGVRSDSDMHTLGFDFQPWKGKKAIVEGSDIRNYLQQAVEENDLQPHIRLGHAVQKAEFSSSPSPHWNLTVQQTLKDGTTTTLTISSGFLMMCAGYYNHDHPYDPGFDTSAFEGTVVHPQSWPQDLDYSGKRIIVIGSGATAVTLVPALIDSGAGHVTMLQRSPTYVVSKPEQDWLANLWFQMLPSTWAYALVRFKNSWKSTFGYHYVRADPQRGKELLLKELAKELPQDMIDQHFTPSYHPWDQRICLVPNGDLFRVLRETKASVVTDTIDKFVPQGIQTTTTQVLPADIIVTATGLQMSLLNLDFVVNGKKVNPADTVTYQGIMCSTIPNMIHVMGYFHRSWTPRADLVAEYLCRLLHRMDEMNVTQVVPTAPTTLTTKPFIDQFTSGYLKRANPHLPKQGDVAPWTFHQDYEMDKKILRRGPILPGELQFSHPKLLVANGTSSNGVAKKMKPTSQSTSWWALAAGTTTALGLAWLWNDNHSLEWY